MEIISFLIVALAAAVAVGVSLSVPVWRGTLLLGDRRAVDRLAAQLATELHLRVRTEATLRAMGEAARDAVARTGR